MSAKATTEELQRLSQFGVFRHATCLAHYSEGVQLIHLRTTEDAPLQLLVQPTPPLVYLDYCVVADLAVDDSRGPKFRDAIVGNGGTLFLSWAHILEIIGLGVGPTYDAMDSYLSSFGPNFVLIESNAQTVIEREPEALRDGTYPAADAEFTKLMGANWDGLSELSLGIIFAVLRSDSTLYSKYKDMHKTHKEQTKQIFDDARAAYRTDAEAKRNLDSRTYPYVPSGPPPTSYLLGELTRECVRTNDQFNGSDAIDFQHSVVGGAYSEIVVLDKKWARRLRALSQVRKFVEVFDTTEVDQMITKVCNS